MDQIKIESEENKNSEDTLFRDDDNDDEDYDSVTNFIADHEVKVEIKEEVESDLKIESEVVETKGILYRLLEGAKPQDQQKDDAGDVTILNESFNKTKSGETIIEDCSANKTCKCLECNMLLIGDIINHTCKNIEEGPITCNICCKSFTDLPKLNEHKAILAGKAPLKCAICKNMSKDSSDHDKHIHTHKKKSNTCVTCGKSFNARNSLIKHTLIHTGEKPFNCDVCNKSFNVRSNLVEHMRIHTGERPFECNFCNKTFCQKSTLNCHLRIHTGEKSCACNICGKLFSRQSSLNGHLRRHNGEKPYSCHICSKSFSESSKLVLHTRTHTGEKPFPCKNCSKCFYDQSTLKRHIRVHTGEKPFKCSICYLPFSDHSTMKRHERNHVKQAS